LSLGAPEEDFGVLPRMKKILTSQMLIPLLVAGPYAIGVYVGFYSKGCRVSQVKMMNAGCS
jgi:hypothetical protein